MHAVLVTAATLALFLLTDLFAEGEVGWALLVGTRATEAEARRSPLPAGWLPVPGDTRHVPPARPLWTHVAQSYPYPVVARANWASDLALGASLGFFVVDTIYMWSNPCLASCGSPASVWLLPLRAQALTA